MKNSTELNWIHVSKKLWEFLISHL